MEELRQMALAYHAASGEEARELVSEFFEAVDPEQKGFVTFEDFVAYTRLVGRPEMGSRRFFEELKEAPESDHLEAVAVLTLFYIIKSGRPFCQGACEGFVRGAYFACVKCLRDERARGFNVCAQCMAGEAYVHVHGRDHVEFVDPFAFLHSAKMDRFQNHHRQLIQQPSAPSYIESFYNIADSESTTTSTFLNEVRERQGQPRRVPLADRLATLVQISLSFGNFMAAIGACTIM